MADRLTRQGVRNLDGPIHNGKRPQEQLVWRGKHEHDWRVEFKADGSEFEFCSGCEAQRDQR